MITWQYMHNDSYDTSYIWLEFSQGSDRRWQSLCHINDGVSTTGQGMDKNGF